MRDRNLFRIWTTAERLNSITDYLKRNQRKATLKQISDYFQVSEPTIRRMLYILQGSRKIKIKLKNRKYWYVLRGRK